MSARRVLLVAAGLGAVALSACDRNSADPASVDRGAYRNGDPAPPPPRSPTTLSSGAKVWATPTAEALKSYLDSDAPAGRVFDLTSVSFVKGMEVREDPNGSLATIAAILRAHPAAHVRIEVALLNPGTDHASSAAEGRAEAVAAAFRRNGAPASQLSSAGVKAGAADIPRVRLVVTAK